MLVSVKMPPPSAKRPFGADAVERLPLIVLPLAVTVPDDHTLIPPPSASLATPPAVLWLTVVFVKVRAPQVSIPPPFAHANGQGPPGHGGPAGTLAAVGPIRFVTTLSTSGRGRAALEPGRRVDLDPSARRTVVGAGEIERPLDVVTPPVMVTPEIFTVGSVVARYAPIVTTGPPPRMIVAADPADTRSTPVDRARRRTPAATRIVAVGRRVDRGLNHVAAGRVPDTEMGADGRPQALVANVSSDPTTAMVAMRLFIVAPFGSVFTDDAGRNSSLRRIGADPRWAEGLP